MLCIAATSAGRSTLAQWLMHPGEVTAAEVERTADRGGGVARIYQLREEIVIAAAEVAHEVEEAKLDEWSRAESASYGRGERIAAIVITVLAVIAFVHRYSVARLAVRQHHQPRRDAACTRCFASLPLLVMIVVVALFARGCVRARCPSRRRGGAARARAGVAGRIARRCMERQTFAAPRLVALRATTRTKRRHRIAPDRAACANSSRCSTHAAISSSRRSRCCFSGRRTSPSPSNAGALESGAEIVALDRRRSARSKRCSRSARSRSSIRLRRCRRSSRRCALRRRRSRPSADPRRSPRARTTSRIGGELRLLIVSGSNMSGKSTLLRAIGVNAILALAGAPVCAHAAARDADGRRRLDPHQRLAAGRRVALLRRDPAHPRHPAHARRRCSSSSTKSSAARTPTTAASAPRPSSAAWSSRGAIGLATTHDLALAQIADELAPAPPTSTSKTTSKTAASIFDYRMRPGVVTKSNALELMRAVGIEV